MSQESGLRNPEAAVRGVGAGALALEALVLLLALVPAGRAAGGVAVAVLLAFVVVAVALAGLLRRAWAWWAATGLQAALLAGGVVHWSLAVLGVVFGLVWAFVLYVRRRVLS